MIRPILMASVIALAAPALAQTTDTTGNMDNDAAQTTDQSTGSGMSSQDHSNHNMTTGGTTATTGNAMDQGSTDNSTDTDMDTGMTTSAGTVQTDSSATMQTGTMDTGTSATMTTGTTGTTAGTMDSGATVGTSATVGTAGTTGYATGGQTAGVTSWAAPGASVPAANTNPEEDARGIAVISAPAFVPLGWNGMPGAAVGGPAVDAASGENVGAEDYPACSATVTDNCLQAYERGRR